MRVIKITDTGEIRAYLRSFDEITNEEGQKVIPGLSQDRAVVDEVLEGDALEAFLNLEIRPKRDDLLKASDSKWIELDSQDADLTAIKAYKQSLRDFPANLDLSNINYVDEIVWPELA